MLKKIIGLTLSVLLMLSLFACNGSSDGNPLGGNSDGDSAQKPSSDEVSAEPTPEPTPTPVPLNQAYLTGLEKGPDYPEDKRVTAIMISNDAEARPHYGLSDAQIVVEITVEYYITRLMAIYEDYEGLPKLGPMRSARDQFLQLIIPMQPFYIHDGPAGEVPTTVMLRNYKDLVKDIKIANSYRDRSDRPNVPSEFTEFTDGERIAKAVEKEDFAKAPTYTSTLFNFVPYNEEPRVLSEGTANDLGIVYQSSFRSLFNFNSETKKYEMFQYNNNTGKVDKTIDPNHGNVQVSFDNVIIIFAAMEFYPNSSLPKVDYQGGGGFYFNNGSWERFLWKKGAPNEALYFYPVNGEEGEVFYINPGTTYLGVVDDQYAEEFHENLLAGESWNFASKGQKNANISGDT